MVQYDDRFSTMKRLPVKDQVALIQKGKTNAASRLRGTSKDMEKANNKTDSRKKEMATNRGQSLDST